MKSRILAGAALIMGIVIGFSAITEAHDQGCPSEYSALHTCLHTLSVCRNISLTLNCANGPSFEAPHPGDLAVLPSLALPAPDPFGRRLSPVLDAQLQIDGL